MKSLWDEKEAAPLGGTMALRIYASRLLGRDPSLVLHGGGNTSVKIREKNLFGEEEEILYVKGTGRDLAFIDECGFTPLRREALLKLLRLESLLDADLENELSLLVTRADAPAPSIETFLHAILPHQYVDHTHSDAVLAISNTDGGEARMREIYGDRVIVVPYVKPGFTLAKVFQQTFSEASEGIEGVILMHHGIFTFGKSAKASYEKMVELVDMAEKYLAANGAWELPDGEALGGEAPPGEFDVIRMAALRKDISDAAGFPVILSARENDRCLAFARRKDVSVISQQGPATPDHVLRTKRVPMLGLDTGAYAKLYEDEFKLYAPSGLEVEDMLDPAPRVVLDTELGLCAAGRSAGEATAAGDVYEQTVDLILRAQSLGGYRALSARKYFEVEYWALERSKLDPVSMMFAGEVALVTGAASGIGKACVASLMARGAAVIGLDLNPAIESIFEVPEFLGLVCDVTSDEGLAEALGRAVRRFGGIDMGILNAGIFPASREISGILSEEWRRVMRVNTDSNLALMRECYPLLKLSPCGGRVVAIGSKNVPAPGRGAAAYSASKAALVQLMRVAALEWGGEGIRINMLHPNAVFDTAVWTDEVLASRAESYGLSVEDYKKRNVLNVEVTSRDVAELAAEMCGPLFAKTTAAQVPIDGGNDRVI